MVRSIYFGFGSDSIKYIKKTENTKSEKLLKSQKLFKLEKSKNKKLVKFKNCQKIRILLKLIL